MGDRGNVVIRDGKEDVWLYTHWSGSELPDTVMSALARGKERWTDAPYLARIVFCEMVKGREDDISGFGISTSMGDNEHDIIVLDVNTQKVLMFKEASGGLQDEPFKEYSFTEYAKGVKKAVKS